MKLLITIFFVLSVLIWLTLVGGFFVLCWEAAGPGHDVQADRAALLFVTGFLWTAIPIWLGRLLTDISQLEPRK